jgi:FAD/FMN-containing dehydrogenase
MGADSPRTLQRLDALRIADNRLPVELNSRGEAIMESEARHDFLHQCRAIVGASHALTNAYDTAPYLKDWSGRYQGQALAVIRPGSTEQVAELVRLCRAHRVAIVPQGGNTGLAGGATPHGAAPCVVIQLGRMNKLRKVDAVNNTITVEAGALLADVQAAAHAAGRLFPLSLAAEGTCTVGGNLATNAGGTAVLRYGNMRNLCLGLEVVTADGRIWDGLRGLRKDNTGYSLRDVYVGSEGTLGIITAAVLALFPEHGCKVTCLAAVPGITEATTLLQAAQQRLGSNLTAAELMSSAALAAVAQEMPQVRLPLAQPRAWMLLMELSASSFQDEGRQQIEALMAQAIERGLATDVAVAASLQQAQDFWAVREAVPEAQARQGFAIRYDISLPISELRRFVDESDAQVASLWPDMYTVTFGHIGDGNLHYNVRSTSSSSQNELVQRREKVDRIVYDLVQSVGGSISAEHGIGQAKCHELRAHKSAVEMDLMRSIKMALDPDGLMNPGKVLSLG